MNYTVNNRCLLCNSPSITRVLSLTPTPLANALQTSEQLNSSVYPLDLDLCRGCNHLQLGISVDPKLLFIDYTYTSPPAMRAHWEQHALQMISRFSIPPSALVVEVGSNNGDLLRFYKNAGMRVLGIEPASEISKTATENGIPTVQDFFSYRWAREWRRNVSPEGAKLVLANNVFAHIQDLADVMRGVEAVLQKDGIFIAEVAYRGDMLDQGTFDLIYHEHLHYHAVAPLYAFFDKLGFHLFDVQKIDIHGGSIRVFVQRNGGIQSESHIVSSFIESEITPSWDDRIARFASRIDAGRKDFRTCLDSFIWGILNGGGVTPQIAILGCPAKLTPLTYHFGIHQYDIAYVCDDASTKTGKFTPGMHWPIVPFERLLRDPPSLAIVSAWNYADELMARVKTLFRSAGRSTPYFLIPFPTPQIVT